jgi:hypothetical protein
VRSGPPRLQSFRPPSSDCRLNAAFDRGPPPLIAAANQPASLSLQSTSVSPAAAAAGALASSAPGSENLCRPSAIHLSHFLNQNLPTASGTVIPPLVPVVSVPPPVAQKDCQPPAQPGTGSVVAAILPPITTDISSLTTSAAAGVQMTLRPTTAAADLATTLNVPVINVSLPRPVTCDSDHASPPGFATTASSPPSSLFSLSAVLSRQRLPLPSDIVSRLDLTRPVSLKLSSTRVMLHPNDFIVTPVGCQHLSPGSPPEQRRQVCQRELKLTENRVAGFVESRQRWRGGRRPRRGEEKRHRYRCVVEIVVQRRFVIRPRHRDGELQYSNCQRPYVIKRQRRRTKPAVVDFAQIRRVQRIELGRRMSATYLQMSERPRSVAGVTSMPPLA